MPDNAHVCYTKLFIVCRNDCFTFQFLCGLCKLKWTNFDDWRHIKYLIAGTHEQFTTQQHDNNNNNNNNNNNFFLFLIIIIIIIIIITLLTCQKL